MPTSSVFLRLLVLVLVGANAVVARADDDNPPPPRVTEADYTTWSRLRMQNALVDAWKFRRGSDAQQKAASVDRDKAFAAVGWTQEKHQEMGQLLDSAVSAVQPDADPSEAEQFDKVTLATARAHQSEIRENISGAAEEQVRKLQEEDRAGKPPSEGQLAGRWVIDLDASVDTMAPGLGADAKADIKGKLKDLADSSYTFGPGNSIESNAQGKSEKGTYRLEGRKLFVRSVGSQKERSMDVGLRDSLLIIGVGMGKTAFRKK